MKLKHRPWTKVLKLIRVVQGLFQIKIEMVEKLKNSKWFCLSMGPNWKYLQILSNSFFTKCENITVGDWSRCLKSELEVQFQQNLDCKLSYFNQLSLPNLTECKPGENDYQRSIYRKAADIIWLHWLKGTYSK